MTQGTQGMQRPTNKSRTGLIVAIVVIFILAVTVAIVAIHSAHTRWNAPPDVKARPNPVPATNASIAAGMMTYDDRCVSCHGDKGDGNGKRAPKLSVQPTDFTDAEDMARLTDGDLFWRMTVGRRPMPAFKGRLSEQERWELVDYIRTFAAPHAPATAAAPPATAKP
jgi:mono/diheme cytochrome c family protein